MARAPRTALLALVLPALACADRTGAASGGTVLIAATADADAMLPALRTSIGGRMVSELLFDPLCEVGPSLNTLGTADFQPRLATGWTFSADSLVVTLALDPRAHWHDGQPVVARDVVSGLAAIREPANASSLLSDVSDIDSVHVVDEHTVALHFHARSAEQLYAASLLFPLPAHLVDTIAPGTLATSGFAQHPVGSGPYRFVSREPTVRLELGAVADHYRGRPGPDRIAVLVSKEPSTAIAKLWTEEADVFESLPATDIAEAAKYPHARLVASKGFDYVFLAYNFRDPRDTSRAHPLLADPALRRAVAHAVDRQAILRAVFEDSLARLGAGPVVTAQAFTDTTIAHPAFDTAAAGRLLDSLGWTRRDADGFRVKGGRRLTLRALVPAPSANRVRAAVIVQEQLRTVGIEMPVDKRDGQAFGAARDGGDFDLIFGGWGTTPSPRSLRGTWVSRATPNAGRLNSGNYRDPAFDAAVLEALASSDGAVARARLRDAQRVIAEDVAAVWLYENRPRAVVHRRFVLPAWRADAWWRTLPSWRVERGQALPRDATPAGG